MSKYTLFIIVLAAIVAGVVWFKTSSSASTALVNTLEANTVELEDTLDDLTVSLRHDDLSASELLTAQTQIIGLLDQIQTATERASGKRATQEHLRAIQDGLGRLARVLETYLQELAELDQRVSLIDPDDLPEDIASETRERTLLMTAVQTITDLTDVATVAGDAGTGLEDTIFDNDSETESEDENSAATTTENGPTGQTAGDAIHLELAPAN